MTLQGYMAIANWGLRDNSNSFVSQKRDMLLAAPKADSYCTSLRIAHASPNRLVSYE